LVISQRRIGDEGKKSWEVWWDEEQAHIQTPRGRFWEILLSTRFFIFQYGVVYALHVAGDDKSFWVSYHMLFFMCCVDYFSTAG